MKESLEDYTRLMRERYARQRGKRARRVLLDEYCRSTGLERKYANKVLRKQRRGIATGRKRGAHSRYTEEDIGVLKEVWLASGQPCGKRFAGAMLRLWLDSWQKHQGRLASDQVERMEGISAAQIDREMGIYRSAGRKRRVASSSLAAIQRDISVRCEPWVESAPGAIEVDTVALCGGSLSGAIIWALDATDIHSGWTEIRAVWNRGGEATCRGMAEAERAMPFEIRKLDFDNGTEFLNAHFVKYFRERKRKVELSRSRPYHKNDNAHVEQKNYTHVRLILGDDRFEHQELVEPLNQALKVWSLWNNLYLAQRRLLRKERGADGKVRRYHEKDAQTPCARLLARGDLSQEQRKKLEELLATHDPIALKQEVEAKLRAVYQKRKRLMEADGMEEKSTEKAVTTRACVRGGAGLRSGRSVASGSLDSLRASPPRPGCKEPPERQKQSLSKQGRKHKTKPPTVSITVRHRAVQ